METCKLPKRSPWGKVDQWRQIAEGIYFASTSSHGGIWLSPSRRSVAREKFSAFLPYSVNETGIWWEEDVAINCVRIMFDAEYSADLAHRGIGQEWTVEDAKRTIARFRPSVAYAAGFWHHPDEYAASLRDALRGIPRTIDPPRVALIGREIAGHCVALNVQSAKCVQLEVEGITVGYWDGNLLHCGNYVRQWARGSESYFDRMRAVALEEIAKPDVAARLDGILAQVA